MESQQTQAEVDPGAVVEASDGRLGTVEEVIARPGSGELMSLLVRREAGGERITVPAELVESIPSRREVRLRVGLDQVGAGIGPVADGGRGTLEARERVEEGEHVRVPIAEERLVPAKRPVELGEIRVHKRVEEVEDVIRQPLTRDEVTIERVRTSRPVEGPVGPREEGEWLIVPIVEEVLVVQKRLMVTEEVRIRRHPVVEEQEIRETVRRERVDIEDTTGRAVRRDARTRDAERDAPAGYGPDEYVRRAGSASTGARRGDSWEHLRQEIREAGDRGED